MSSVDDVRKNIDEIDAQIIELMAKRKEQAIKVGEAKVSNGLPIREIKREEAVLARAVKRARELGLDAHVVTSVFSDIIADSFRTQRNILQEKINPAAVSGVSIKVAFQQALGKYSAEASDKCFPNAKINLQAADTLKEVLAKVESGLADYAVLPLENNSTGSNNEAYDSLLHSQLYIAGEVKVKFEPCLIAKEGSDLKQINTVYCHPQDALLCKNFLSEQAVKIHYLTDQESAVQKLTELNNNSVAAITGKLVEELKGLKIIAEEIGNQSDIYSRYVAVSRKPLKVDLRVPAKTSIVFSTAQKPGALVDALAIFKELNINLTKLESRPVQGNNWEEMFYVDFEGNAEDERVKMALEQLGKNCKFFKVLGCYPGFDLESAKVSAETIINAGKTTEAVSVKTEEKKAPAVKSGKKAALSSRAYKQADTVIEVGGVKIGGNNFMVMAGPCSVESFDQIMNCARHAKENGTQILRGGCFKPRTNPYSFQGLGFPGLEMLQKAGRQYGMPIITEIMAPDQVQKGAEMTDIIQIGARNMQNYELLKEVGKTQRPVMLKRGMSSTLQDLLDAAEYILAGGNMQVILCERGIRTFETATRFTLDISSVPVLKRMTHLPIVIDPSHPAGERDLVPGLAVAAKAIGAHGVIVEFHPEPEKALSDGPQALYFPQFEKLMKDLSGVPLGNY